MDKADVLVEPLTRREVEILSLLVKHRTNKEIASSLNLSVNSVKWYARQIYGKLGVENRRQAADRVIQLGLLPKSGSEDGSTGQPIGTHGYIYIKQVKKPRHNLPIQLTSFVGREIEIKKVKDRLKTSRLVTLTGAGGVGKTRLALAVSSQIVDEYKDGVWLVELAPLGEAELIPALIASIFGLRADQNRSLESTLLDYLDEKQLLLVLDNCEHLVDACAGLAGTILRASPQVSILATSREPLGIEGETPFLVPSLAFPVAGNPGGIEELHSFSAVRLFIERAQLPLPGFAVTETNASTLAQVCQRLDGIPLALELAAARLQVLSLEQIAARLDDRFRLLTGGSRRALPRHQTLHSLIDWSYDLLTSEERILLRRLSVFARGWTIEAAEAVCAGGSGMGSTPGMPGPQFLDPAGMLDLLSGLVNKSLVTIERDGDVVHYYRLPETIRQYAQEKLMEAGEAEMFRDRHLDYYLALAEESESLLRGPGVVHRLELLDGEIGNLRLALGWSLEGEYSGRIAKGLQLGSALKWYWSFRGFVYEGIKCLKQGLELLSGKGGDWLPQRAKAEFTVGDLMLLSTEYGWVADARSILEESLLHFRECQDQLGMALVKCALGYSLVAKYLSVFRTDIARVEYPRARELGEQGLAVCRRLGKVFDVNFALLRLLGICTEGMELPAAKAYGEEALASCLQTEDYGILNIVLVRLGLLCLSQADLHTARLYMQKALAHAEQINDKGGILNAYAGLGAVAYYGQDFGYLENLMQSCFELSKEVGSISGQIYAYRLLAVVMLHQEDWERSKDYSNQCLALALKTSGYEYDLRIFLTGMAGVALGIMQLERAVRLLGAAEAQFENFYKPMDAWDQAEFDRIVSAVRQQVDEATFSFAWAEGRQLTLDEAISEARQITPRETRASQSVVRSQVSQARTEKS